MREEPSFATIVQGPFSDYSKDTPKSEIKADEARTVLRNWIDVATYYLPRCDVFDMLEEETRKL